MRNNPRGKLPNIDEIWQGFRILIGADTERGCWKILVIGCDQVPHECISAPLNQPISDAQSIARECADDFCRQIELGVMADIRFKSIDGEVIHDTNYNELALLNW